LIIIIENNIFTEGTMQMFPN